MSLLARSGHGTLIERAAAGSNPFVLLAELKDITWPELTRNEFDATIQSDNIDSYVHGVQRRSPVVLKMNFIDDSTQDELTGLYSAMASNSMDGYRFTAPTSTPWIWIASGQVQKLTPMMPVDGLMTLDVTLRLSSKFYINGVLKGS